MRILVFKHVAHEVLGTLNPLLRDQGFRIRYVNFHREPDAKPSIEKYNGLVIYGGWMGVYEADRYPHIKLECQLIEQALKMDIPVLGICLGAQILAHTLGAKVSKHTETEVGWQQIELTPEGQQDQLLGHFQTQEKIFQMHGDTFDIPKGAIHLARSNICNSQAFRYGSKAYGMQFHLEVDKAMIERFLSVSSNRQELENFAGQAAVEKMELETERYLERSIKLSTETFTQFIQLFGPRQRSVLTNVQRGQRI